MATLFEFVEGLSPKTKEALVDTFFRIWSSNGFGTMTKKDTELLLFRCLADLLGTAVPKTNYEWAHLLRVTPQRVRALRLESHLRFGFIFPDSKLTGPARYFGQIHALNPQLRADGGDELLKDVTVSFVLEDPVAQMELENQLKELGAYLDFHRNREVVRIRFIDFLRVVQQHASASEKDIIDRILSGSLADAAQLDGLRSRLQAKSYHSKPEADKLLEFVTLLGETFAEKPTALVKHLALILRSQESE